MSSLLFESKHWWKEVGIIIFFSYAVLFSIVFVEGFIIAIYDLDVDDYFPDHIDYLIIGLVTFFNIWMLHRTAIKKKDNEYHLFQSNEWWKEVFVILGIDSLLEFLSDHFIFPESFDEYSFEYMMFFLAIHVAIIASTTFSITWLLHRIAIKYQKNVTDSKD
ncbi:MAG: hypothetical protein ACPKPY_03060 [Nitrososphaeraceae archaeon]